MCSTGVLGRCILVVAPFLLQFLSRAHESYRCQMEKPKNLCLDSLAQSI